MSNLSEIFAFSVEKAIKRKGISLAELGRKVGESRSNFGKLVKNPRTLKTIEKIAEALEMDPLELLMGGAESHPISECYRRVSESLLTPPLELCIAGLQKEGLTAEGEVLLRKGLRPIPPGSTKSKKQTG